MRFFKANFFRTILLDNAKSGIINLILLLRTGYQNKFFTRYFGFIDIFFANIRFLRSL